MGCLDPHSLRLPSHRHPLPEPHAETGSFPRQNDNTPSIPHLREDLWTRWGGDVPWRGIGVQELLHIWLEVQPLHHVQPGPFDHRACRDRGRKRRKNRKLILRTPRPSVPSPQSDILEGAGWSLRTFFLVLRLSFPGDPAGQGRGTVSPPAMASSKVSGGRLAGVWRVPEGAWFRVPAETGVDSSNTHQEANSQPLPIPSTQLSMLQQDAATTWVSRDPGPAPTFQLSQHFELGRELVLEVILHTIQIFLVVFHGARLQFPQLSVPQNFPRRCHRAPPLPESLGDRQSTASVPRGARHWPAGRAALHTQRAGGEEE